ncbi:CoA-binding protein, partial [Chloroflexota bacterium]
MGPRATPRTCKGGAWFLDALIRFGYRGDIYPMNPRANEIMGLTAYPDIESLPRAPDYVISCLPAVRNLQLVKECASKGVRAVSIFSSGFGEAGQEGRKLERELVKVARENGIRVVGPNCMGIYSPATGLSFHSGFSKVAGRVGLICQSGGNSIVFVLQGNDCGIRFSKVLSYGNAADLTESDFLEYLAEDPETGVIAIYIEGA